MPTQGSQAGFRPRPPGNYYGIGCRIVSRSRGPAALSPERLLCTVCRSTRVPLVDGRPLAPVAPGGRRPKAVPARGGRRRDTSRRHVHERRRPAQGRRWARTGNGWRSSKARSRASSPDAGTGTRPDGRGSWIRPAPGEALSGPCTAIISTGMRAIPLLLDACGAPSVRRKRPVPESGRRGAGGPRTRGSRRRASGSGAYRGTGTGWCARRGGTGPRAATFRVWGSRATHIPRIGFSGVWDLVSCGIECGVLDPGKSRKPL